MGNSLPSLFFNSNFCRVASPTRYQFFANRGAAPCESVAGPYLNWHSNETATRLQPQRTPAIQSSQSMPSDVVFEAEPDDSERVVHHAVKNSFPDVQTQSVG